MVTWKELKNDLSINQEDQNAIALERDLIRTMVAIREEKGLTQSQLAKICNVKQPVIARMESSVHQRMRKGCQWQAFCMSCRSGMKGLKK